jgi:hypothetical protein
VVLLISAQAAAQFQTQPDSVITPISPEDSARIVTMLGEIKPSRNDTAATTFHSTKSPGVALLLSALLPGAGQLYNESYWKIPILLGFGYYFASQWIDNNDSTKHYRTLYAQSVAEQNENSRYQQLREFYKDQRDTFSWYIFIYYIVNLVDAYVDASLYDFNVGDDLSIRVAPEFDFRRPDVGRVSIRIRF